MRCLIARPEKQRHHRQDHLVTKVRSEPEQARGSLYWQDIQNLHQSLDPFQLISELLISPEKELVHQRTRKHVRPEVVPTLPERDPELHLLNAIAVLAEEVKRVLKDRQAALNAIVGPARLAPYLEWIRRWGSRLLDRLSV